MRVIAGIAKGHTLKGPKSAAIRPTSDKVRGAIFAMLEAVRSLEGTRVLDLYAGTGALGIEALSRGAAWCDFVEANAHACRLIAQNLEHTRLQGRARVHCRPVAQALAHPDSLSPYSNEHWGYDIILADPPYGDPDILSLPERLAASPLVHEGTLVVLEHPKRVTLAETYGAMRLLKSRRYGDTCISIYIFAPPPDLSYTGKG